MDIRKVKKLIEMLEESNLEEIEIQYKKLFLELGGEDFSYIPCLNDSTDHISLISKLIETETKGWLSD